MAAPEFDVCEGVGEEGVMLFLRFSIAASLVSRSSMDKGELDVGRFLDGEGSYIRLEGIAAPRSGK